ncbi:hypothetical protein EYE40_01115 [Glaciihabitans arcticus]|uniref:Transglutaminase-like domain-containing protein n=1 Tax=Glaciihabitans arcticus TaxID=2668039 RepID=A0A4Q9GN31_9MICO|nr:DUF3488 and transglutaminase-like domain-containing protein [Glaciihabitans arcticus]TBN56106.1 hypothetical protein EYE40_01115 [Glaciihabitans arcticus]
MAAEVKRDTPIRQALRAPEAKPTWQPRGDITSWGLSVTLLIALGVAAVALGPILEGIWWWVVAMATALIVTTAMAVTRLLLTGRGWPVLVGLAALLVTLSLFFAAPASVLGIIPSPETIDRFSELVQTGLRSIATQKVPADPIPGILFLVASSFGLLAIALDAVAITLRRPALTGPLLLLIVLTPTFIGADLSDPFFFLLAGIAWLVVLHVSSPFAHLRNAVAIGGLSLALSLVLQLFIFPIPPEPISDRNGIGYVTGINPILTLGENLRRQEPITALTYKTDAIEQSYITFSILDNFDSEGWVPSEPSDNNNDLGNIGRPPGLGDTIPRDTTSSIYTVGNIGGKWLPVPYAPTSISGVQGEWTWDPESLTIRTENSSMRNQEYVVTAVDAQPTVADLERQDDVEDPAAAAYLNLPINLPPIIRDRALEVTANAETRFDQALALQRSFRTGAYQYSETAPVEDGFDGNDGQIIARFLGEKTGYCQHFASAMAIMARTLGIPSRVAVGFTPGQQQTSNEGDFFLVTTANLHAWPELYFTGVGWVRFEPTPGRGEVPVFGEGDPNAPTPAPNTPEPTPSLDPADPVPTSTPTPTVAPDEADGSSSAPTQSPFPIWLATIAALLVLLMVVPAGIRSLLRSRRRAAAAGGDALAAWTELDATARDLRLDPSDSATPREFEAVLVARLGDSGGIDALERLRAAVETAVYDETGSARSSTLVEDLDEVLPAVRRASGWPARVRGWVAPASLAWGVANSIADRRARAWSRRGTEVFADDVIPPSLRDE